MGFLPEELKSQTFPCPNCQQYISSEVNVCKFCFFSISDDLKQSAIEKELNEKKNIYLNRHKNTLILGITLFVIGIFLIITPVIFIGMRYSNNVNINCLTPIFIIAGVVIAVKGFVSYREEKRRL